MQSVDVQLLTVDIDRLVTWHELKMNYPADIPPNTQHPFTGVEILFCHNSCGLFLDIHCRLSVMLG